MAILKRGKKCLLHPLVVVFCHIFLLRQCQGREFNITVPGTHKYCIMVDVDFQIEIRLLGYDGHKNQTVAFNSNASDITTFGICNSRTSTLNIIFNDQDVTWGLVFQNISETVSLDSVAQFRPDKIFPEADEDNIVTYNGLGKTDLCRTDQSYKCDRTANVDYVYSSGYQKYKFSISVRIERIHAQAFGIESNKFSPPRDCQGHSTATTQTTYTTTSVTLTTVPETTIPDQPDAPLNNYTIRQNGITCIVMDTRIVLEIQYVSKERPETHPEKRMKYLNIPSYDSILGSGVSLTGSCHEGKTKQTLNIHFFNGWFLEFTFELKDNALLHKFRSKYGTQQAKENYALSKIKLHYVIDARFYDAVNPGKAFNVSTEDSSLLEKYKDTEFYKCDSMTSFRLESENGLFANVRTENLKLKAFNDNSDATFSGEPTTCSAEDGGKENTAAIVVGVVVAGLVLFVLLSYIGYRWHRFRGYQNI